MVVIRKPSNRKERISFIIKKKGFDFACFSLEMTDGELKKYFDKLWNNGLKTESDYIPKVHEPSICLRCGEEIEWISSCGCGEDMAVVDVDGFDNNDEEDQRIKAEYLRNHPEEDD